MAKRYPKKKGATKHHPKQRIEPASPKPEGLKRERADFGDPERLNLLPGSTKRAPRLGGYSCTGAWDVRYSANRSAGFKQVCRDLGNVTTLYHGTPHTNITGIMKEGLRPGSARCMFGSGIYLGAPNKAIGFAGGTGWRRGDWCSNRAHYIIEVKAALGKVWVQEKSAKRTLSEVQSNGYDSVAGIRGVTASFSGTLQNTEHVIYSPDQVQAIRVFEYQKRIIEEDPDSSGCQVLRTKNFVQTESPAFTDLFNKRACGKNPTTLVDTSAGEIRVCADCIRALKLKRGSKIEIKNPNQWRRGKKQGGLYITVRVKGAK